MIINGILTVPGFTPTENPGEYSIEGGIYNNQGDTTGNGAFDVVPGFVLYVQASDVNTFFPILGRVHRYKITSVTAIDQYTLNLTILWDESGSEIDTPTSGVDCIITSTSTNLKYGFSVDQVMYPTLGIGLVAGLLNKDVEQITDLLSGSGGSGNVPIRVSAPTATLTLADTLDPLVVRSVKWMVTITNIVAGKFKVAEVLAIQNGSDTNHIRYGDIGDVINCIINVSWISGLMSLTINNSEADTLTVDVVRISTIPV
jgi:hypothetical protein